MTLYRWHQAYRRAQDARALIPRFDRRGGAGTRQSERIRELFGEAAEEAFQASPSATIKSIFTRLEGKIRAENAKRLPADQLRLPAVRTVYRLFGRLEAYDQTRLAEITRRIAANGDDPSEYVEISYRISETKFNAWPESLKSAFAPARTLKTGKPGFRLALLQE